jgi:hypothetical protein
MVDPSSAPLLFQVLQPMVNLDTLILSRCPNLQPLFLALNPHISSSNVLVCPRLEKLVVCIDGDDESHVRSMIDMAAARARRGVGLKSIRIVGQEELESMAELRNHVSHVEYFFTAIGIVDEIDDSDIDD